MLSEEEIISTLNDSSGYHSHFTALGDPYSFLIDCRLNIFKGHNDRWAIAIERLGYNPRGGTIELEISYFGNCIVNQESHSSQFTNTQGVFPIDNDSYFENIEEPHIKLDATHWSVRGVKVPLSNNKKDYFEKGIELKEYEPATIGIEEAARLAIIHNRNVFRATDPELYKLIPVDITKIMTLDEWYHKDFNVLHNPYFADEVIISLWDANKKGFEKKGLTLQAFTNSIRQQEKNNNDYNKKQWEQNRPGSYETWPLLAKVIVTGDASFYKPTLAPNTHWLNWPESGSL